MTKSSYQKFLQFIGRILTWTGITFLHNLNRYLLPQAACALVINENGEILAVSRKNNVDDFGLPGGKKEATETLLQTVRRETYEETGRAIFPLVGLEKFYEDVDESGYWVVTYRVYIFQLLSNVDKIKESGLVKWANRQELLNGSFAKYNKKVLNKLNSINK